MGPKGDPGPAPADSVRVVDCMQWDGTSEVSAFSASRRFQQLFVLKSRRVAFWVTFRSFEFAHRASELSGRVSADGIAGILRKEGEERNRPSLFLSTWNHHKFSLCTGG